MTEIITFFTAYFGIGIIAMIIAIVVGVEGEDAMTGSLLWPLFIVVGVYALFAVLIHDGIRAIAKYIAAKRGIWGNEKRS